MSDTKDFAEPRQKPLSDVPEMGKGNRPVDGGAYTFSREEMENFVSEEPGAEKWFRQWIGGPEFLRGNPRFYLYLKDATDEDLAELPKAKERVEQVAEFRGSSQNPEIAAMAGKPAELIEENIPDTPFVVVPTIVSERRSYAPMGIMEPGTLVGTTLYVVPDASLYELGVLESGAHMLWMREAAEKVREDYHYSPETVYNTFPWPTPTEEQKERVRQTAQGILDARAKFPDKSLAVLYDDKSMPPELRKAHEENDHAVMEAYGMDADRAADADVLDLLRIRSREARAQEDKQDCNEV